MSAHVHALPPDFAPASTSVAHALNSAATTAAQRAHTEATADTSHGIASGLLSQSGDALSTSIAKPP